MKTLSLKLDDAVFLETEQVLMDLQKPRNRYINEALKFYNRLQKRNILARELKVESNLVGNESLIVLDEFENLREDED